MNPKIGKLSYVVSLILLATLLLSACAAPTGGQQSVAEQDQPVVTVFKSPT